MGFWISYAMMDTRDGWVDATIAGFRAMGASRHADAAVHWLGAHTALASAAPHDPWLATSQTNAGAAHLLLRQQHEADMAFAEAERSWIRLLDDVATADVALPGRSSSFHFRLASRNLEAFQDVERARHAQQCEAGLAITRFNRALAGARQVPCDTHSLIPLLSDALGARAADLRLLGAVGPTSESDDTPYADKAEELTARYAPAAAALTDGRRRLEAAVALTVLIRPGLGFQAADDVAAARRDSSHAG